MEKSLAKQQGNKPTAKRSQAIATSSPRKITPKAEALVQTLVRIRQVQGWGLQPAADAKLMASVWEEQLDRRGVNHRLYSKLVDMAVDYRTRQISNGDQPTPLTVELLLACFEHYKRRTLEEHQRMKVVIDALWSTVTMVSTGQKQEMLGWADLHSVADVPEGLPFHEAAKQVIDKLQEKYDRFLGEKLINDSKSQV